MNDIVDRIKLILEDANLSPSSFADTIDIQRSSMSHMMSGRNKPSLDVIQKILNKFPGINSTWLLTGNGKMKQLDLFELDIKKVNKAVPESGVTMTELPKQEEPVKNPEIKQVVQQTIPDHKAAEPISETLVTPAIKDTPNPISALKADHPQKKMLPTEEKQIEKILVFYTDKTFSVYKPE